VYHPYDEAGFYESMPMVARLAGMDRRTWRAWIIRTCVLTAPSERNRPREDGRMRYVCNKMPRNNRCGKIYILADPTDEHVIQMVKIALDSRAAGNPPGGREEATEYQQPHRSS
jgi:hypothetical protein